MKKIVLFLLLMMSAMSTHATAFDSVEPKDSLVVTITDTTKTTSVRKHPWLAGFEIVGFNVALVGFNRLYHKDETWSHITMEQIKHNITHRYWIWDHEGLGVNGFRHPVHGSLYYLTARANGMSMAASSLYTLGGSWE